MVSFTVHHVPVPQPRQRHAIRGSGDSRFIANYTPTRHPVNQFKSEVQLAAMEAMVDQLDGPLSIRIVFVMLRPKKYDSKKHSAGRLWYSRKPDADNLFKSVADALNGLAYRDDSQLVDVSVIKFYAARNEQPHVEITIKEIVNESLPY